MGKKIFVFIAIVLVAIAAILIVSFNKRDEKPISKSPSAKADSSSHEIQVPRLHAVSIENPHLKKLLDEYEYAIQQLISNTHTPGAAIAIVKDSSVIYLKGFGLRETGTSDSVNTETVFRLASVSKCFAPVLTGILVEDSLLRWDDKVIQYVPDFALKSPEQTAELNLRHVLSHTVGLPYHTYTNLIEDGEDLHSMLTKLRDVNMINKVGKVYSYQNVAYSLISEVVQSASGKTYEQLMIDRIFKPLHMYQASISYDAISSNDNVARPHRLTRKGLKTTSILSTYYNTAPAGGVNASISDMARWLTALLGNRQEIVSSNILNEVFTPVVKAPYKNRNFRKWLRPTGAYYGLGWRVLNFRDQTLCYHGGYVNGYRSELAVNRKEKIGICVLTNLPGAMPDNAVPIFFKLYSQHREAIEQWELRNEAVAQLNPN
jgi:beta-lactamase class C